MRELLAFKLGQVRAEAGTLFDVSVEAMKSLLGRVRSEVASSSSDGPRKGVGGGVSIEPGRMNGLALSALRQIGFEPRSKAACCAPGVAMAPDELRTTQMSASPPPMTFKIGLDAWRELLTPGRTAIYGRP